MPSSHLILCRPLLLLPPIPPSIRVFSNESTLHMRWPKFWSFSFSISPSNEHPGLISFYDGLVGSPCSPRDSQESSPTPQFKSINSSALSFLHSPTLTSIWKVVAEWLDAGFLTSGGDEFNPGPEMRLDHSELLCNKVLLKYKGDRESFWHRHQKGAKEYPPPSL